MAGRLLSSLVMNPSYQSSSSLVPNITSISSPQREGWHPAERLLARYATNDMGARAKKPITRHLESCEECRRTITRQREIARRFRDFERCAIANHTAEVLP